MIPAPRPLMGAVTAVTSVTSKSLLYMQLSIYIPLAKK